MLDNFPEDVRAVGLASYVRNIAKRIGHVAGPGLVLMELAPEISPPDHGSAANGYNRARAAIERLGVDTSRLSLAVGIFGWGSPEANATLSTIYAERLRDHDSDLGPRQAEGLTLQLEQSP